MQSVLPLFNLLEYAGRTRHSTRLYVRPHSDPGGMTDDGIYSVTGVRLGNEARQEMAYCIEGWLSPFWRMLEKSGWRVAQRSKVASGERLWTLARMEEVRLPGLPTRDQLLGYVEKVRPLAGERAERALEIATSGKVHKLTPAADGRDRWEVACSTAGRGSYSVSIEGHYCTCPDAASGAPRWLDAPLCKHRLAVMFIYRWEKESHNGNTCSVYTPSHPAEYVGITAPSNSTTGWRWTHVQADGASTRYSQQEYPDQQMAMRVARTIADCKALPLYLNGFSLAEEKDISA